MNEKIIKLQELKKEIKKIPKSIPILDKKFNESFLLHIEKNKLQKELKIINETVVS